MSKLMTLGEAKVFAKESFYKDGGLADEDIKLPSHKPRMSYKQACEYYGKKLFRYWLSQLSDEIPPHEQEAVLRCLLGIKKGNENAKKNR